MDFYEILQYLREAKSKEELEERLDAIPTRVLWEGIFKKPYNS